MTATLPDGQYPHGRHAQTARRANLSQPALILLIRNFLDADPKSDA
ncbi:MAG TPA: hypothetical protein VMM15_31315 [Bradyrhizobium sp.]|nr:hypothetical protein [Bradyrhizobium sp.]